MSPVDTGKSIAAPARVALAPDLATQIAKRLFGVGARAEPLHGEYDNFRLLARDHSYVLKFAPVGVATFDQLLERQAARPKD